jgi:hypothetical protein
LTHITGPGCWNPFVAVPKLHIYMVFISGIWMYPSSAVNENEGPVVHRTPVAGVEAFADGMCENGLNARTPMTRASAILIHLDFEVSMLYTPLACPD